MASTFYELFGDFVDAAKLYTEKLDVTERSFMRMLTRGIQAFQIETEYIEKVVTVTPDAENLFMLPPDCYRVVDIRLESDPTQRFLSQEKTQFDTNVDRYPGMRLETPNDYNLPMPDKNTRLYHIWGRQIIFHPYDVKEKIVVYYIPDLHSFSSAAGQWNLPDIIVSPTVTQFRSWFPLDEIITHPITGQTITRFKYLFDTTTISAPMDMFEKAFLDYALAEFIKSKGSPNFLVYEKSYSLWVEKAKLIKPTYFKQGVSDYYYAPRS